MMWAVIYWAASLLLYTASVMPLMAAPDSIFQDIFGAAAGLTITLGLFGLRSRSLQKYTSRANKHVTARVGMAIQCFSVASFLAIIFILCAYYIKHESYGEKWLYMNWVITPFAFFFFLVGKWTVCRFGATYERGRRKSGRKHSKLRQKRS